MPIARDYHRKGVEIIELGVYMKLNNVTYHFRVKPVLHNKPTRDVKDTSANKANV